MTDLTMRKEFERRVYSLVSRIPSGMVATYGQIARLAHIPNPRYVGYLLHRNPDPKHIPCHRVVNSRGKLSGSYAFGGYEVQKTLLVREGVAFCGAAVDMRSCMWNDEVENS
ncbi:MAG: Methylated-DNA--protein-cysteine methyltransferase, constitutive [bacterium ADurb.Bin400]|nr:MAG: Methylated-DNA--protein-cysteine methyltransferase, constitutive [bacterium ADurb.Bin400]